MSDSDSSIPANASVYRFVPVKNFLNGSEIYTGVTATVVHEPKVFRSFNGDGTQLSFLVNLKTHVAVNLDATLRQIITDRGRDFFTVTLFAERLRLGYVYDGEVLKRAPGVAFAPRTQEVEVSDTTTSEASVNVSGAGVSLSFGVTETVTISVTDWLVALNPVSGHLLWDYYVNVPYNVTNGERPPLDHLERLSNISLVGFSFDTIAWFEVFDLRRTSVELRPAFSLRVASTGPVPGSAGRFYETKTLGDTDVTRPSSQPPLVVDLTKVPNRPRG